MCNFKTCFWDLLIFTSNIIYNIKNSISEVSPNELSIMVQNNFFVVRNKITYYIDTQNKITSNTSLNTLNNKEQLNKITTNFFIPYIILYYNSKSINLELQGHAYTYYVVGNSINRNLINFYLEKKENIVLKDNEEYTIEFMNSDFKTTLITDESTIYFDKDSYKLI